MPLLEEGWTFGHEEHVFQVHLNHYHEQSMHITHIHTMFCKEKRAVYQK